MHGSHLSHYRTCHSTQTALPKVHPDIDEALSNHCVAAIVLRGLSAAFDVSDQDIHRTRLAKLCLIEKIECVTIGTSRFRW